MSSCNHGTDVSTVMREPKRAWDPAMPYPIPRAMPRIAAMPESMSASLPNIDRTCARVRPRARNSPISRVRSTTDRPKVFATPTMAMMTEITSNPTTIPSMMLMILSIWAF